MFSLKLECNSTRLHLSTIETLQDLHTNLCVSKLSLGSTMDCLSRFKGQWTSPSYSNAAPALEVYRIKLVRELT